MNKKNVYSMLLLLFIFVFSFMMIYLFAYNKKVDNYSNLTIVKDYNIYFSVVDNVNNYVNILKNKDADSLYYLLNVNYIKKHKIKSSNILNKIKNIPDDVVFSGDKIYYLEKNNKYLFLVTGKLINEESQVIINNNYIVAMVIDYNLFSVSFYPIDKKEEIDYIVDYSASLNDYNKLIPTKALSDQGVCKLYYEKFIRYVNNDVNELYNLVTDDIKGNYTFNNFSSSVNKKYNNYKYNFYNCVVEYEENTGKRVFSMLDKKNNNIYFYEDGVMNLKLKIDLD